MKATQVNGRKGMLILRSITFTLVVVIIIAFSNIAHAQTGELYLKGESKHKMINHSASSQYGNGINIPNEKKPVANIRNDYNTIEADKYLKTTEAGRKYTSFEVYDVKGMNKEDLMLGLMTNTVDRGTRYNDKGTIAEKTPVAAATITKVDVNETAVKNEGTIKVAVARFGDKVFVIVGENDYRYMDGKVLEGKQKLVNELMKGKPVTETTFYFELKNAGIINNGMSLKQFTSLNRNQKQQLLNGGTPVAAL